MTLEFELCCTVTVVIEHTVTTNGFQDFLKRFLVVAFVIVITDYVVVLFRL
jgi:hypothetical protein